MALRRLKTAGLVFVVISILPSRAEAQGDPNAGKSFTTDLAQACARGLLSQSICEAARGGSPQAPASSGAGSGSNFPSQGSGSMASGITNSGNSGISFTPLLPPTSSNPGHGLVPMSPQSGYRGVNSGYSQPISGSSNAQGSYSGSNTPNTGYSNPSSGFGSPGFGQQQSMMPQGGLSSSGNVVPYQLPAQSASSNPAGASGGFNINPGVPSSIGDTFPRGGYSNTNVGYGNGMSSGQSGGYGEAGGYSTGQRTQQAGAYSNGNGYGPNTYAAGNANPNGYGTAYTPMPLNNGGNSYYRNTGSASFSSQLALFALLAAPKLLLPFFASGR